MANLDIGMYPDRIKSRISSIQILLPYCENTSENGHPTRDVFRPSHIESPGIDSRTAFFNHQYYYSRLTSYFGYLSYSSQTLQHTAPASMLGDRVCISDSSLMDLDLSSGFMNVALHLFSTREAMTKSVITRENASFTLLAQSVEPQPFMLIRR